MLSDLPVALVAARDAGVTAFPPETGTTFVDNARVKARHVTTITGKPALADDSGLVVDALDGAPGVYSARFGGAGLTDRDRSLLLLSRLAALPDAPRTARFIAALALSLPDGGLLASEGRLEGSIADAPRGTSGFGYDPIFIVGGTDHTLAQLRDGEKNAITHRARALHALRPQLVAALLTGEGM
ncbi:MAG: RdgB/HAM1 family non-canonical purine NTP pyrophosphatase [Thermomicrobia bacterium]|nr:RdgB/HAM1 family non-canonical purine NTP pyrophosphatase [Thermomicrobia bacterium]